MDNSTPIHIVDLSHRLVPGKQRFKLDIRRYSVDEYIPEYKVAEGEWYIMEDIEICTHVGTHVEAPYHAIKDGKKAADIDFTTLIGMAVVLDFTDKGHDEAITRSEIAERGKGIIEGDIVLIKTGLSKYYGTKKYLRPYLKLGALDWLIEKGIKCLGVDCSGIEDRTAGDGEINHKKLFSNNIPLIEDMNNLDKLNDSRVFLFALPLPIEGLDASPIRPIAVEPLEIGIALRDIFLSKRARIDGSHLSGCVDGP
jgi:arylformamidase